VLIIKLPKIAAGVFLILLFGAISAGAFMERRTAAIPLGLIFGALALYCLIRLIKVLRGDSSSD
jgi:hypothetical protein